MPANLAQAFKKWGKEIYAFIYLRVSNKAVAEDLTQEVFLKAWRSKDTFNDQKSSFKTWLFVIARNTLTDFFQQKSKTETQELNEEMPSDSDLQSEVNTAILTDLVFDKLKLLSEKEQELIILRYKLDYKLKDISAIMDLSLSDAKVTLHRAMKKLLELCKTNL